SQAIHRRVQVTQVDRAARFALARNRHQVLEKTLLLKSCVDIARDGALACVRSAIHNHEWTAKRKGVAPSPFVTSTTKGRWDFDTQGTSRAPHLRCCREGYQAALLDDAKKEHAHRISTRLCSLFQVVDD